MLDIKFIRENQKKLKEAIKNKGIDLDLDVFLEVDKKRVLSLQYIEELQAEKNKLNELMKKANDSEKKDLIEQGKAVKDKLAKVEPEYEVLREEFDELMVKVPIIPAEDVPVGKDEKENVEIYKWGEIPKFSAKGGSASGGDFVPKDHIQLGKDLDILDFERGTKVSGYRGYYVKNEGASLQMAIMMYAFSKMVSKGFAPMIVPTLVKDFALFGSGYFKGKEFCQKNGIRCRESHGQRSHNFCFN